MYPNVLSLDAPLVAIVWMYVFAWMWNVNYVEPLLPISLGLVVWMVYALDRLLDLKIAQDRDFPLRHLIHQRYAKPIIAFIGVTALGLVVMALYSLQWSIVQTALLPLFATGLFFTISLFSPQHKRVSYSKNLLAGYAFAWGVGSGLVGLMGLPQPINFLKLCAPEVLIFGLLCVINITAVDLWVDGSEELDDEAEEWALTMPLMALALFSVLMMRRAGHDHHQPFYVSMLIAAALMYMVNRMRRELSAAFLRMVADLILLIAAVFFFLMH